MFAVGRGLPTETTLTRPARFHELWGGGFTSLYLGFFRFLTAKSFLLEVPAFPKWMGATRRKRLVFTCAELLPSRRK